MARRGREEATGEQQYKVKTRKTKLASTAAALSVAIRREARLDGKVGKERKTKQKGARKKERKGGRRKPETVINEKFAILKTTLQQATK